MLLAKANNELPVFVLNGNLLLPRASEYLIWDDGLAPIRYLYSGHATIDTFGSIPLNRVDAFVWYCDYINKVSSSSSSLPLSSSSSSLSPLSSLSLSSLSSLLFSSLSSLSLSSLSLLSLSL